VTVSHPRKGFFPRGFPTLILLSILFLSIFIDLDAQEIAEIMVEGNLRVSGERIVSTFQVRPGDPFSIIKIQRGIRKLADTGLFEDIAVLGEEEVEGILLIIRVSENPTIRSIGIEGVEVLKQGEVTKELTLKSGSLFNPSQVVETKNKILALYREEGYPLATVSVERRETEEEGIVDIMITMDEGRKVDVETIDFEGNNRFSDKKIRGEMKTEQDGFWFWQGTHFKEDILKEDLDQRVVQFYTNRGYLDFFVESYETKFDREKGRAYITVWVNEGESYDIGEIDFVGNEFFSRAILRDVIKLEEGQVFSQEDFDESLRALYELYGNQGYLYSDIAPQVRKRDNIANVTYYITENDPAYIRKIVIQGNEITHEKVIRREVMVLPGDRFKQQLLVRSFQRLMNTGYFEMVDIQRNPTPDGGNDIDMVFDVTEKRTGQASTGAGFGAGGGLTGFVELSQTNLFGKGQKGRVRLEHGSRQTNFELSFTEPFFRDTQTSVGFDLFRINQAFVNDPFRRKSTGGAFRVGVPMPGMDYTRFYTTYRLERFDLEPQSGSSIDADDPVFEDFPRLLSGITLNLVRDTRDNTFHPTSGTRHSITAEYAGGILGGSTDFQKYRLNSSWSMPSFWKFNLSLKAKGGVVTGYGDPSTVPINEKFILGGIGPGIEGLRGYNDRSVGPVVNGRVTRGRAFLLLTAEEEMKITEQVYAILFFDAGNAWESLSTADPTDLKRSIGFGVRIEIPGMGPLGLDIGYGLDRPDGTGFEPHITFGAFF
jgi:outer membrane protein insertion porin family